MYTIKEGNEIELVTKVDVSMTDINIKRGYKYDPKIETLYLENKEINLANIAYTIKEGNEIELVTKVDVSMTDINIKRGYKYDPKIETLYLENKEINLANISFVMYCNVCNMISNDRLVWCGSIDFLCCV